MAPVPDIKEFMTLAQLQQRREAAPKGGLAVLEKYGRGYLQELGRRGGRLGGRLGGRPTFFEWLERARKREQQTRQRTGKDPKGGKGQGTPDRCLEGDANG